MKIAIGFVLSFLIGAGCRYFDIPAASPAVIPGALIVLAMTSGYTSLDRMLIRKDRVATTKHLCGAPPVFLRPSPAQRASPGPRVVGHEREFQGARYDQGRCDTKTNKAARRAHFAVGTCPRLILARYRAEHSRAMADKSLNAAYAPLGALDFSRAVLATLPQRLLVLRDRTLGWADLGSRSGVRYLESKRYSARMGD